MQQAVSAALAAMMHQSRLLTWPRARHAHGDALHIFVRLELLLAGTYQATAVLLAPHQGVGSHSANTAMADSCQEPAVGCLPADPGRKQVPNLNVVK